MKSKISITINRPSQPGMLMSVINILPFLLGSFCEWLGLPWALRYILDVAWAMLLVLMWFKKRMQGGKISRLGLWTVLFIVYTALSYLLHYQSVSYYLWGMRNNFRFFAAFFAFAIFLKPNDVQGYFKLFDILFWIDIAVSMYQYFLLGINGDHLGGVFGTESGANGYTNLFFVIMLTKDVLFSLDKRKKLSTFTWKLVAMIVVVAFAEIKFFFAECVLVVVLTVLFTNFTWRKLWVIIGGLTLVVFGAVILAWIYPNSEGFLSLDYFIELALSDDGYTSSGDLNRLNAIARINELWLKTGWQRLFGLGLGNCDTAKFAFLNTPFYESYGDMHYTWLSYAFMYLECGWIGLIFYFGFFVLVYLSAHRIEKRSEGIIKTYCRMSRILALMCMVIAIYNSSLRTEAGYMMFFALSVPFAMDKKQMGA